MWAFMIFGIEKSPSWQSSLAHAEVLILVDKHRLSFAGLAPFPKRKQPKYVLVASIPAARAAATSPGAQTFHSEFRQAG